VVATGRETTIQLPPAPVRPRGLFVDIATQLTETDTSYQGRDRLGQGVQHQPWGCAPLTTGNLDCSADLLLNGDGPAFTDADPPVRIDANTTVGKDVAILGFDDVVVHPAFKVVDGLECSTLSFPDLNTGAFTGMTSRLQRRMRVLMSAALTGELVSGWASGGPSLSSEAVTLAASVDIGEAAEAIEAHLAETLLNLQGVVYLPPALVHHAVRVGWVRVDGGVLATATGHLVVADAGHDGSLGPSVPGAGQFWIYASGIPAYRVSDTMLLGEGSETLVLASNIRQRLAEAYAQLAFDPCPVGATLVDSTVGS
jgi:hypothetical protein